MNIKVCLRYDSMFSYLQLLISIKLQLLCILLKYMSYGKVELLFLHHQSVFTLGSANCVGKTLLLCFIVC